MAKILGKDEATYSKERDGFLRDLQHFHESRGTPFKWPPTIGGKEVDLYLLYNLVTSLGGWIRVNSKNSWTEILSELELQRSCVNGSVAIKQIYLRYLDRWEKVHFLHEEGDRASDDDEESRHKRWSAKALHSVPYTYNYSQHNVTEGNREYNHLSPDLYKPSDYDRLALSLISPLPNEQDFAINVCTLISNDGKHTLKLQKHPRIINYLLAHAGVFNHSSLRQLFMHFYSDIRKKHIHNFWKDALESTEFLDLTNENNFKLKRETEETSNSDTLVKDDVAPNVLTLETPMEVDEPKVPDESVNESDCDCEEVSAPKDNSNCDNAKFKIEDADNELFCLGRLLGTQDYVGQRVLQIATILRNLTFIEENIPVLVKNTCFIRFMLLCCTAKWNILRNLGMDMLSNIAAEFIVKDLQKDVLASTLLKIVTRGLDNPDRACCLSALEVLNKISQNEKNEDVLLRSLEARVYKNVCSFLTIHDVMLLIYTLECLYSLSSLGERSCHLIVINHGVIDTLVSLVTVEGKSYGPKACIGMKLVETLPCGSTTSSHSQQQPSTTVTVTTTNTGSSTQTSTTTSVSVSTSMPKVTSPSTPARSVSMAPQRLLTVVSSAAVSPVAVPVSTVPSTRSSSSTITTPVVQPTPAQPPPNVVVSSAISPIQHTSNIMTPQQLIQQQHAHQQAIHENEQFALAWLRATYEPCRSGKVDHQELYKHYMNSCSKIGRRGVISPLHFPRCVRSVFGGTVGPNPMKPSNPNDPQFYEGIKAIAHPHLSQALLNNTSSASTTTVTLSPVSQDMMRDTTHMQSQSQANQQQQQASNTSLIKSLLATKVNDCMSTVSMRTAPDCQSVAQVAARQQQQRLLAQTTSSTPMAIASPDNNQRTLTSIKETPKTSRINGMRQLFTENDSIVGDPAVSSTTQFSSLVKGKKEPPQPPPPPLAPLSNNIKGKVQTQRIDNEDSDSTGNNSIASSSGIGTVGIGGISSTEDGDNSLTCFEGLLNGIPTIENPLNEDSNSKDSVKIISSEISINKPLRLADLLEKKFEKSPPLLNGVLNKDMKGEKTMDLVENHIEKALSRDNDNEKLKLDDTMEVLTTNLKRSASDDVIEVEPKKPLFSANVNGSATADSPNPDSVSSSNGDEPTTTVSTAAAKLFADIAADILEDEDEEQLLQEAQASTQVVEATAQVQIPAQSPLQQIIMDNNQQVLLTQPRQIIVSQSQIQPTNQVVISAGTPMKTQTGQTVIVQNPSQILLSHQPHHHQVQLLASTQPGQYVLQASGATSNATGAQSAYVVATASQPQATMVHGQPQAVLLAHAQQQQGGSGAKTIIILQQQPSAATATHHQKVVVTPQGQQVVVTQVPRPISHTSSASNSSTTLVPPSPAKTTKLAISSPTGTYGTTNGSAIVIEKKEVRKTRIIRDLTTPYVCEWGDCNVEKKFKSANEVYLHACAAHCPTGSEEIVCQWDRCDNMKRKRFSLMTHLHDKHCNTESMKQGLIRRKQAAQGAKVDISPASSSSAHPGYAPDAALHAIKRHALEFVNPKELQLKPSKPGSAGQSAAIPRPGPSPPSDQDDNEGPVTKSIRLTASLILRNLVIYSSHCKRYLKSYESHLANVALSNVESSRTIAQVLYDMNDGSTHR